MKEKSLKILKELIIEIIAFFILTFSMALFWKHNLLLSGIYLVGFFSAMIFWKDRSDIAIFVIAAVFFQIGELIIVYFGAWTYNNPSYLNIPLWLGLSWGYIAVIIKRFGITVTKALS